MKNKKQEKSVVGYVRTATVSQKANGSSIKVQERKIKEYCKTKGYQLSKIFSDNGQSGANLNRPGLTELLTEASGKKISKVICLDVDRLSRRAIDFLVLKSCLKRYGVSVVTIAGVNAYDGSSRVMDEMFNTINSFYSQIRERRKNRSHKG